MTLDEKFAEAEKKQKEILEMHTALENKKAEYKAFTKAAFGLADGEQINVLDVARAIKLINSHG